ncbi:MAG: hypothetical protein QXK47_02400 [Candidatus Bathyarchaeia archaeon]
MPLARLNEEKTVSINFARVVDDEWTVEAQFEGSDLMLILQEFLKTDEGRKFASLLFKALADVKPYTDEEMQRVIEEENRRMQLEAKKQAYELILHKARQKGLDLKMLIGDEVENELFRTKEKEEEAAPQAQTENSETPS